MLAHYGTSNTLSRSFQNSMPSMPLRIQHAYRAPYVQTSIPQRRHICVILQTSIPPCRYTTTLSKFLHTPTLPHLQFGSRTPNFHTSISLQLQHTFVTNREDDEDSGGRAMQIED